MHPSAIPFNPTNTGSPNLSPNLQEGRGGSLPSGRFVASSPTLSSSGGGSGGSSTISTTSSAFYPKHFYPTSSSSSNNNNNIGGGGPITNNVQQQQTGNQQRWGVITTNEQNTNPSFTSSPKLSSSSFAFQPKNFDPTTSNVYRSTNSMTTNSGLQGSPTINSTVSVLHKIMVNSH